MRFTWIYTTWPDTASAEAAAGELVEAGLCACANLLPGMISVYRWEGTIATASECVMILKTQEARIDALKARILALHPYDTPCLLALPVEAEASHADFLQWIAEQTAG
ncbi:divalent-cation tolerance protein CutA [Maricaulis parjimensis]|uniref:divalent-cation tolerance protein CutA n=1 Tax=Maricaulis parjimensis TaxID=144023 RepID=UPI00193A0279|nr:divalent-cation tolerance protein CutA [Maricaulis parjimensis]